MTGRIVKRTGDGSIIEFRSVVDAVRCAIEVQSSLAERQLCSSLWVNACARFPRLLYQLSKAG
jgi:class 3 adenylate cyclase